MRKIETSIRFSPGTLDRLKAFAHNRSLETGKPVTLSALVRDCVERNLLSEEVSETEQAERRYVPDTGDFTQVVIASAIRIA